MHRLSLILLFLLCSCAVPPATPGAPEMPPPAGSSAEPAKAVPALLENASPEEAALLLAHGVRNRLADGELAGWLSRRASYPFDIDGKSHVVDAPALRATLDRYEARWAAQTHGQSRCEAISRDALLGGKRPFHYLDRLGDRPQPASLAGDLDRLGLGAQDILVNCYTPNTSQAGYTVIATPSGRTMRLKSFRN